MSRRSASLQAWEEELGSCRACPRLVAWRERVAREKRAAYAEWEYWGRPVPSLGPVTARLLVVGLAPAAHGGNRTGRMFTGDRSGDWLYEALHAATFCNQPSSEKRGDGLRLVDARITAVVHCAPPDNKPAPAERDRCLRYLARELGFLARLRVVVALGAFAWDGAVSAGVLGLPPPRPRPRFAHGAEVAGAGVTLLGSYHPSQQNTFTGRLTRPMLQAVFSRVRDLLAD